MVRSFSINCSVKSGTLGSAARHSGTGVFWRSDAQYSRLAMPHSQVETPASPRYRFQPFNRLVEGFLGQLARQIPVLAQAQQEGVDHPAVLFVDLPELVQAGSPFLKNARPTRSILLVSRQGNSLQKPYFFILRQCTTRAERAQSTRPPIAFTHPAGQGKRRRAWKFLAEAKAPVI